MMPELSEETLDALIMGCDASDEYGPVVRTLVAAYRSAAAALRAERTRTETLRAALEDIERECSNLPGSVQGEINYSRDVARAALAASVEDTP